MYGSKNHNSEIMIGQDQNQTITIYKNKSQLSKHFQQNIQLRSTFVPPQTMLFQFPLSTILLRLTSFRFPLLTSSKKFYVLTKDSANKIDAKVSSETNLARYKSCINQIRNLKDHHQKCKMKTKACKIDHILIFCALCTHEKQGRQGRSQIYWDR